MSGGYHRPSTVHNHAHDGGGVTANTGDRDLPIDGEVQNVKSARVYVFGDASVEEEEFSEQNGVEMPELRARGSARKQLADTTAELQGNEASYFEKTLTEEDTLLGVSLKYGCKVSELKRINNLIRDQDFYGLKVLRIPLRRHGLLTELIQEHMNGDARQDCPSRSGATGHGEVSDFEPLEEGDDDYGADDDNEHRALLVRNLSIRDSFGTQSRDAVDFLKKMDSDIRNIVSSTNSRKDTLDEVRDTLTCKRIYPLHPRRKILDGVDCGMRWWSILIVMLVVLLGGPLLYFLYFEYVKPPS